MNLYSVLKFLHVLSVIMFVGGIFARQLVRSLAKKAEAVQVVAGLSWAAGRIDMVLVRSGSTVALAKGQASGGPQKEGDKFPSNKPYYEIPIAIQDRAFNADGSLFCPNTREFFDPIKGPFIPETELSPLWNPEFFGNMNMVNPIHGHPWRWKSAAFACAC